MRREDRYLAARLEGAVSRHKLAVANAGAKLIDELRTAGFKQIDTVDAAYQRLEAQRKLPGLAQHEIDIVLHYATVKKARKAK